MWKVDKSNIEGYGLIAYTNVSKGFDLGISHYGIGMVNGKVVGGDITELGVFQNHSDIPNCINKIVGEDIHMVTIKDIKAGEEFTIDYRKNKDISINIEYEVKWLD